MKILNKTSSAKTTFIHKTPNILLRSEEAQELIDSHGTFLERGALYILLVILGIIVCGSFYFKYPDKFSSKTLLSTAKFNTKIAAAQSGKIFKLLKVNTEHIQRGDTIIIIELLSDQMRKYVVKAPLDGILFFTFPIKENLIVESGKTFAYIQPADKEFVADIYLTQYNIGKVDTGLRVQLQFDAYPYKEFGTVEAKIKYISRDVTKGRYIATAILPTGLRSSRGLMLPYRDSLNVTAVIVSRDRTVFQWFYHNLFRNGYH